MFPVIDIYFFLASFDQRIRGDANAITAIAEPQIPSDLHGSFRVPRVSGAQDERARSSPLNGERHHAVPAMSVVTSANFWEPSAGMPESQPRINRHHPYK
eukprot:3293696-Pleurochrysis_carterae.AAC.7